MTFQSAVLCSGLSTENKPVLSELSIGPNFRAPIKHSSMDWEGAGGRRMHLRKLKDSYHCSQSIPSVSLL